MVIGTSALAGYEIDGAVNIYAGCYNNPFLIWGKYRKKWLRATLPVSFQFHHTQLDGIPAAEFLERLQREIQNFKISLDFDAPSTGTLFLKEGYLWSIPFRNCRACPG